MRALRWLCVCWVLFVAACGDDEGEARDARDASGPGDAATPSMDGGVFDAGAAPPVDGGPSQPPGTDAAGPRELDDAASDEDGSVARWVPGLWPRYPPPPYPAENPDSDDKAVLGKILFWDEQLSSDDTVACGTCHRPRAGGSDPRAVSARHPGADGTAGTDDDPHGATGIARCRISDAGLVQPVDDPVFGARPQVTHRKPPSYLDATFAPRLFWDLRAEGRFADPDDPMAVWAQSGAALESQSLFPLMDDREMACEGRTPGELVAKVQGVAPLAHASELPPDVVAALTGDPDYPELFRRAFGTPEITTRRIAFAIATHERRLRSDRTPWDRWNAGEPDAMTARQVRGFEVFMDSGCSICHSPPLFHDASFHNVGFVAESWDPGVGGITGVEGHAGSFRTPTLRNVGLRETGGLMHHGLPPGDRLESLIDAYARAERLAPNTSVWIRGFEPSAAERAALADFLRNALTDPRVARAETPFDRPTLASETP